MVKNLHASAGDWSDSWVRKVPWRRNWQLTQYSCLGNPMDRQASLWGRKRVAHDLATKQQENRLELKLMNAGRGEKKFLSIPCLLGSYLLVAPADWWKGLRAS